MCRRSCRCVCYSACVALLSFSLHFLTMPFLVLWDSKIQDVQKHVVLFQKMCSGWGIRAISKASCQSLAIRFLNRLYSKVLLATIHLSFFVLTGKESFIAGHCHSPGDVVENCYLVCLSEDVCKCPTLVKRMHSWSRICKTKCPEGATARNSECLFHLYHQCSTNALHREIMEQMRWRGKIKKQ